MRLASAFGIALVAAAPFAHGAGQSLTPGQVFEAASPSVVVVNGLDLTGTPTMQGSGVVIAPGVVVSNCHVFKSVESARVLFRGEALPATLRHMDTERDLCSFTAMGLSAPPARLGDTKSLRVGDRVYAIGAPRGLDLTLSDGLVSSLRALDGGTLLQVTAPISPGSSGGGLFDSAGRLVGITTMQWKESQQLNFAVPVEWAADLPVRDAERRRRTAITQPTDAKEKGRLALNALGDELQASDAAYAVKLPLLLPELTKIKATLPPEQWADATRRAYAAIHLPSPPTKGGNPWILIGKSKNTDLEIDSRTVRWDGKRANFWVRSTHSVAEAFEGRDVKTELLLYILDCDLQTLSFTDGIYYGSSGELIKSWKFTEYKSRSAIAPESVGWTMLTTLCK